MKYLDRAQIEAKEMIEMYLTEILPCFPNALFVAKRGALMSINKIISLRVQPLEYFEAVKKAILNYKQTK